MGIGHAAVLQLQFLVAADLLLHLGRGNRQRNHHQRHNHHQHQQDVPLLAAFIPVMLLTNCICA
jgi:hypothetical protein